MKAPDGMKRCPWCGETKPLVTGFTFNKSGKNKGKPLTHCRKCHTERDREWRYRTGRRLPMAENKSCSAYLGVHIAERALGGYFDHVKKMPYGNPGYDFICGRGYKIDIKSACKKLQTIRSDNWGFCIHHNTIADYFLLIAFDNRESLQPEHIWLVPSVVIAPRSQLVIADCPESLDKWCKFERPIERAIVCCTKLRSSAVSA